MAATTLGSSTMKFLTLSTKQIEKNDSKPRRALIGLYKYLHDWFFSFRKTIKSLGFCIKFYLVANEESKILHMALAWEL